MTNQLTTGRQSDQTAWPTTAGLTGDENASPTMQAASVGLTGDQTACVTTGGLTSDENAWATAAEKGI